MPPLDYDLIILGGSLAAREAAIAARALQARVALVEPDRAEAALRLETQHRSLMQIGRLIEGRSRLAQMGLSEFSSPPAWAAVRQWAEVIATDLAEETSLSQVAAAGVDVVVGQGEFFRRPHLGVRAGERTLRSRAYLLAPGSRVRPLEAGNFNGNFNAMAEMKTLAQTPAEFLNPALSHLPGRIAVWGEGAQAVELAQALHRLGSQVTLLLDLASNAVSHSGLPGGRLTPASRSRIACLDSDLRRLLLASLEADGIAIYPADTLTQVHSHAGTVKLALPDGAQTVDCLLNATEPVPDWDGLNLEAANIRLEADGLRVYPTLQTFNARIFACTSPRAARQQAQLAVRNAVFLPNRHLRPELLPMVIATQPAIASIGLTEAEAREVASQRGRDRHGAEVVVQTLPFKLNPKASMQAAPTGFCKLIARRNGRILGLHLAGLDAEEAMSTVAIALQEHCRVRSLAQLPVAASPSTADILRQTAIAWQQQRLAQQPRLQDWLETWQEIRRSRSRWTQL
ncbi:FAD-dependent oxidoreductase [Thermoleptolyngbya sp. C42_A2020_037]|uniref:FAD-dependent oxidoreductase n=1 Tax=Thermoleptolyngbya sp. C42_A2020_037 TaxID=2747799 RepID=UPI0019F4328E|nr:FAD-dependent oxidoreductase [Thermoleptolyngbya sp. C42_A2020_037]MBF2085421.1 NAD(P)/FAD-dependent oxidoreductase [Thermoleptolyngbya sp. C42_A2020_037]